MYRRVDWMKPVDHAILSLLGGSQRLELTPNNIARNIGYNNEYVSKRCKILADWELLTRDDAVSDPFYAIAERGEQYLDGELDPEDLEPEDNADEDESSVWLDVQ